jgi:predicted nucleic acid-binding protein
LRIVADASPLILLAKAGKLELLRGLCTEVVVPEPVVRELDEGAPRDNAAQQVRSHGWMQLQAAPETPKVLHAWDLGAGETSVLAWALVNPGFTAAVDDREARRCAACFAVPCIGTLGLVLAARQLALVPAARPVLEALLEAGLYIDDATVRRELDRLGE